MNGNIKIAVLGTGSWGTALAAVMARKGFETMLWGRNEAICTEINASHTNAKYLPEITLPGSIKASTDLAATMRNARSILVVTPAQTIAKVATQLKAELDSQTDIILCAKGIDKNTGKLPSKTMRAILPDAKISALSGPSFAADVARNLPTAVTLASADIADAEELATLLSDTTFRTYASDDIKGVELGGALKNVIALAIGVCRGMKLGASAEAALIARGFAEMTRLATKLGARPQTLAGLSGLGDLVLTCSSPQSRNFSYGVALGNGSGVAALALAEGAFTASIAAKLAFENQVDCPIITTVASLIDGSTNPGEAVCQLLARPLKQEEQ